MRFGGKHAKCQNGRSCINGKTGNGAHQETSKYAGNLEGSLLGVREGVKSTFCYA